MSETFDTQEASRGDHESKNTSRSPTAATFPSSPREEYKRFEKSPQVDQGLECWIQVAGSFALWLNTWGIINSFGQFQTYYEQNLPQTASQIAWIGSTQTFLLFFVGILSAPLMDAGYCTILLIVGNFLVVFGLMMTSIATKYWHLLLSQGIVTGLGFGVLFVPSIGVLVQYFVARRALAIGAAATASGVGGVLYPIIFHRLIDLIGFGWTVRIIAFVSFLAAIVSIIIVRTRVSRGPKPADAAALFLKNTPLLAYTAGYFLIFMAVYIPPVYIATVSVERHITDTETTFYLLPIMMASSIVGRLALGFVADKIGVLNLSTLVTLSCCTLMAGWIGIDSEAASIVFSVLYGFCLGSVVSLPSPGVAELTSLEMLNTHLGLASLIASLGVLIGTPVAGKLLRSALGIEALQAFAVVALGFATVCLAAARVGKAGWRVCKA